MPTTTPLVELLPQRANRRPPVMQFTPVDEPSGPLVGFLTLCHDRNTCEYKVETFPADEGFGVCLLKLSEGTDATEDHYSLLVASVGDKFAVTCECRGYTAHNHCRHSDAVLAALANRWL
jgi:hypothetical protein